MTQFLKTSLFLGLFIGMLSCSNDDDATVEAEVNLDDFSEASIQGTWDMQSFTSDDAEVIAYFATIQNDLTSDIDVDASSIDYKLTFDENNNVTPTGSFDLMVSTSVLTQPISQTITINSQTTSFIEGDYEVMDDGFTVQNTNTGTMKMTVTSFSDNEMTLSMDLSETEILGDFGEGFGLSNVRLQGTAIAVFERM